jgi:hypothetical protein
VLCAAKNEQLLVLNLDQPDKTCEITTASQHPSSSKLIASASEMSKSRESQRSALTGKHEQTSTAVTKAIVSQRDVGPQNFDPNVFEYTGTTSGLPNELWKPTSYKSRVDFFKTLGFSDEELANRVPELINFCVWS